MAKRGRPPILLTSTQKRDVARWYSGGKSYEGVAEAFTQKHFPVSSRTVPWFLSQARVTPRSPGPPLGSSSPRVSRLPFTKTHKQEIRERYDQGRPLREIATWFSKKYFGISHETVRDIAHEAGAPPKQLTAKQRFQLIKAAYKKQIPLFEVVRQTRVPKWKIRQYWLALEAHDRKMTGPEAAKHAGLHASTVYNAWKAFGLEPHYPEGKRKFGFDEERGQRVLKAHDLRMSTPDAARYAGVKQPTLRLYWNKTGRKPHYSSGGGGQFQYASFKQRIREAHARGLAPKQAAAYVGVPHSHLLEWWRFLKLRTPSQPARKTV